MTCIVDYPTKKAFREALAVQGPALRIEDPSIYWPYCGAIAAHPDIAAGLAITVTNHPKRSWFASVCPAGNGAIKVS
jgi:hypothetical protein